MGGRVKKVGKETNLENISVTWLRNGKGTNEAENGVMWEDHRRDIGAAIVWPCSMRKRMTPRSLV